MQLAALIIIMLIIATGLATGSAYILWGLGVSMLVAAAALAALALVLYLGMKSNG